MVGHEQSGQDEQRDTRQDDDRPAQPPSAVAQERRADKQRKGDQCEPRQRLQWLADRGARGTAIAAIEYAGVGPGQPPPAQRDQRDHDHEGDKRERRCPRG